MLIMCNTRTTLLSSSYLQGVLNKQLYSTLKTWQKQQEDNSEGDIFAELDKPRSTVSKMNLTSMQLSMFQLCF